MEFNNSCYKLKTLNFESGIFDSCVDISYIITMESSIERHKNIMKQLSKVVPTKKVIIVYNKGFKKCPKYYLNKKIDISLEDITYTYMYIYKNSKKYNNILVFEDDFILNEKNLNKKAINEINNFVNKKNPNIYYLGCFPSFINPLYLNSTHKQVILHAGTHAHIINKNTRNKLLHIYKKDKFTTKDYDEMLNFLIKRKFLYFRPLYVQPFLETENYNNWGKNCGNINIFVKVITTLLKLVLKMFKLDKLENLNENWDSAYKKIFIINIVAYLVIIFIFIKIIVYNINGI